MLEVFANGRQCMAQRIYPTRGDSTGIALCGRGSAVTVRRLRALGPDRHQPLVNQSNANRQERQHLRRLLLEGAESAVLQPMDAAYFDDLRERCVSEVATIQRDSRVATVASPRRTALS